MDRKYIEEFDNKNKEVRGKNKFYLCDFIKDPLINLPFHIVLPPCYLFNFSFN
jgi:hypothetical protein